MSNKSDIICRDDINKLVSIFYSKVQQDELLAPIFIAVDWAHHTPLIIDFWSMILLGDKTYRGNPFSKHINLDIKKEHFTRWLWLFNQTVDENFLGEKCSEAKERANNIANIFQHKMGL